MPFLALAILCSTLVSMLMKLSGGQSRMPMLAVNYLTCAFVSALFMLGRDLPRGGGWVPVLGLGAIGGALYLGALLLLQGNVRMNGVTLSSAFMKLGVLVPTLLGLTLFREQLTPTRACGILLTLAAIALLAGDRRERRHGKLPALVLLMLCGGLADGMGKFYAAYGNPAYESHFLFFIFVFALLISTLLCAAKAQRPAPRDWLFGTLLGIPNYFSSRFLLKSLASVSASVAYPVFSCGAILLTALGGFLFFGEKPVRRSLIAIAAVLAALVVLQV